MAANADCVHCSAAAAEKVGASKSVRNSQLMPALAHPVFLSQSVVAANTPLALKEEALRRMEVFVLETLHKLINSGGRCEKRKSSGKNADDTSQLQGQKSREPLLRSVHTRLLVLRYLYSNVQHGLISTQRDIYYRLSRLVPDQGCVNRTLQQLVQQLGIPRQWLGVVPGSRGCVGGTLSFCGVDLRQHTSGGFPLPVRQEELRVTRRRLPREGTTSVSSNTHEGFELFGETRYIIVVEKHAVFFRLMEERIFDLVPCVLLTSHGFPTAAAITLLSNLHRATMEEEGNKKALVPVVALVDYNPSGLSILQQYKHNAGNIQESRLVAVHALRWLGIRGCHIVEEGCREQSVGSPALSGESNARLSAATLAFQRIIRVPFQRFTRRDEVVMSNLITRWDSTWRGCEDSKEACEVWRREAEKMQLLQVKVELETLYDTGMSQGTTGHGFAKWVCRALLRHDYI
ncbi:putative Type IIB DNA topoisomerase [Trypanosoma vivax]|uniref:DNA topoisomerase (ATP-hydrolyzing) n=1 Tax=Trypanosoma vivax (strain Y486) TaxID=1055687 RepID=G0TW03_TRYVY|nr:putative meiotic recombination protein spo11 [Trypanosoma vivax]KAH8606927.1 putative Type IIB DNA topoisomerase [Trypanosoma vivax]CCC48119.1 putative meiotic recombination protein spo11 [Trypanosoma vivax Y486]